MKLMPGDTVPPVALHTIHGRPVAVPDPSVRFVHLQFRRFAGCPVCNFHLLTLARRHAEVQAAGIRQVVFFHSSQEEMREYQARLPFDCVADRRKKHYRQFGVETSVFALLHPGVFWSGLRWILASRRFYRKAENGITGLPADFLVDRGGKVVACRYGTHADDQWSADDVLGFAASAGAGAAGASRMA